MSDPAVDPLSLAVRTGLPVEMRYLLDAFPRERWPTAGMAGTAAFWLQMHAGFRAQQVRMQAVTDQWRSGRIDLRKLHGGLLPLLQNFLGHLDGHHRIESGQYFPAFSRMEPRIEAGLALLDKDHDAIHAHLEALYRNGLAFHQAMAAGATGTTDAAARLAEVLDQAAAPLARHLDDEEEIVIPLMALRGDPHG